jgi:uncharacterized membrane protein YgaE (UPF0421/DUF939 family)
MKKLLQFLFKKTEKQRLEKLIKRMKEKQKPYQKLKEYQDNSWKEFIRE